MADGTYYVGDSIAEGLKNAGGGQGDTKVGRNPAQVLQTINNGPDLTGQHIVLSSGVSNNPAQSNLVAAQIAAAKAKGAASVSLAGVGPRFGDLNSTLATTAQQNGAMFGGGFAAGADGVHPKNYNAVLPSVTGYAPSSLPGAAPVTAAPSTGVYKPSVMDIIAHVETGDRNIVQSLGTKDVNNNWGRGGGDPAKGNFQIINSTYLPAAIKAGIDVNKYPTANSLPPSEQARVASFIPTREWGGATKAAIRAVYPNYDFSKPPPLDYHGGGGAVPTTTTPGTTLNTPPPATTIANALTGGTGANGQGLSPIQQAQQASSGGEGGGQSLQPAAAPQLGMPNMHNQQVEAQAPQLMAALRTAAAQPLSWGPQPFGSTAGPRGGATTLGYFGGQAVPMPGTTLNSIGGAYA